MRDKNGDLWLTPEEVAEVPNPSEMEQWLREQAAWEASPEGRLAVAQIEADIEAKSKAREANPNRLSKRVSLDDLPLIFAQAVQSIFDETGEPCRMDEAGVRAGMDNDEYMNGCIFANFKGLIRHPERNGLIGINLWEPGVG